MDRPVVRDSALLIFRAVVGLIFVAHGWRILFLDGASATTTQFAAWGVPQPKVSAWIAGVTQLLGGGLLVVGLLTTIVAGGLALLIAAAIYFVNVGAGPNFATAAQAAEYPVLMLASLIVIVVFGSGRASVDGILAS